jgi:hypothetical protein
VAYIPSAPELAGALADLLDALQAELPPAAIHRARVGANIARILQRELTAEPRSVGEDPSWDDLVSSVRAELAVVKPGYDMWEGQ